MFTNFKAHVTWNVCTAYGPGEMAQTNSKNKKQAQNGPF